MVSFKGLLLSFLICQPALAQFSVNFTSIDPSVCAAPNDYLTCYEAAVENTAHCVNITADNPTAQKGCSCVDGIEKINCFAEACWNKVSDVKSENLLHTECSKIYGCEYQVLVADYFETCDQAVPPIPYWPAPPNAPGSCSCNTGEVFLTIKEAETSLLICEEGALTSVTGLKDCFCCLESVSISAYVQFISTTSPN